MSKRKTRSQTRLEHVKRLRVEDQIHWAYKLPDLPLLSILSNLDNDDLVSLALTNRAWHGRIDGLSLTNSAFWSQRVQMETRDYWAQYGAVWSQLVKNVPLNLTRFGHALKLFRGIRDKTGVYDENPRDFEPDYWRLKMNNGHMMICSAYRYNNSSHSPFLLRMYMDKIDIKHTNGYCDKSMQLACLANLRRLAPDEEKCFYQTKSMFITWPIQKESKGNQQIVIQTCKTTYSIPSPMTHMDVGHHLSCSLSRNGALMSVVVQMPSITRVEQFGPHNHNRVHLYSLTDTGYTCLGVMRPERSLDDDFHYQELDVQWRDNFLWVQTKFSRNCQIYAFPIDANGSMRKQLLFEEKNCRVYELITFCDRFLILFDEEFEDHKRGSLCQFYFNLARYVQKPVDGPIFSTKRHNRTRRVKELWSDTTKTFFLPFKIDLNHFVCAKHDRSAERLINDRETESVSDFDEPDSAVKAISLYELCFNASSTITEYNPDQVKTPPWTNSIKNSTSRRRLSMIANSRNRVTSIKPSKVCWLKTASWDFMSPARRDLLSLARMTNKRQRDVADDEILARFKRRKLCSGPASITNKL